jgi:hypothetical protein
MRRTRSRLGATKVAVVLEATVVVGLLVTVAAAVTIKIGIEKVVMRTRIVTGAVSGPEVGPRTAAGAMKRKRLRRDNLPAKGRRHPLALGKMRRRI